jgi:predicted CoA-binding protein
MAKPTVAILGASTNRDKYGNKSVRAHAKAGYEVYPVNPKGDEIEGFPAYSSIADVPEPLDRVSMYLPPALGLKELPAIAAKRPKEVWLNPGAESEELIQQGRALGLNMIVACSIVDLGMSPRQFPSA